MNREKQIESCENCLHYSACLINGEYVPTPCRAYEDKASYRKQSEAEWISVEERLPEPKKWVLVFTRHMHHPVVCFYEDVWYFLGGFFSKGQVTHWMPLPEPPKGD